MKESLPDIVLLLEVDRTATASSASNESRSLQLLLVLRTLVGGAVLRRTNGGSSLPSSSAPCTISEASAGHSGGYRLCPAGV